MEVRRLQVTLYRHLAVAVLLSIMGGVALGQWAWGAALALGWVVTGLYFGMLGVQVRRMTAREGSPALGRVVLSMLGRQAVSGLACLLALEVWGTAWWGCLIAILVGRHWVMVAARAPREM